MKFQNAGSFVVVRILDIPYRADREFTYYSEPEYTDDFLPGRLVVVPFGTGGRQTIGVITDRFFPGSGDPRLKDMTDSFLERCKPVIRLVSGEFFLSETGLALCRFLSEMTFCSFGDAVKTVLPSGAIRHLRETYHTVPDRAEEFHSLYDTGNGTAVKLWALAEEKKGLRRDVLRRQHGDEWEREAERLTKKGFLAKEVSLSDSENLTYTEYYTCKIPPADLIAMAEGNTLIRKRYKFRRRTDAFPPLLKYLAELDGAEISQPDLAAEVCKAANPGDPLPEAVIREEDIVSAIRALVSDGFFDVRKTEDYRNPYEAAAKAAPPDDNILNEEQEDARKTLCALYETHKPQAALLYGVTGSGKTRVIKSMIDRVIGDGRSVIMLVPEISLTPQSVAIFCAFYGERVAVMHSGLSAGEKIDVWRRAKRGEVDLVIGTRSAIFAPLENLGMIVIDEEQEHTYKSDQTPRYHAKDAARFLCAKNNALLLLASATPSFESYYKAKSGAYTLVTLNHRYGNASLPEVILSDLHEDMTANGETPLGTRLSAELAANAAKNEQSVFFVNRRGYRKYIQCLACKDPVTCPHCSVPMVLHVREADYAREDIRGYLVCHYCGTHLAPPEKCPSCGSDHLKAFGYGTQKAEAEIGEKFPGIRILRMDTDTTQGKFAHEEILSRFRGREADLLLGTQMVTKGHDFPAVTLVGVLNADALLYNDDFRASERAFSLITQVIGRAGRADKPGRAVIQTYDPENSVLAYAAKQDYDAFYESAIPMRRALSFPPFCDIVVFSFTGADEGAVKRCAQNTAALLLAFTAEEKPFSDVKLALFGPFEAQIYKVNEKFRMRIVLKCRLDKRSRALLASVLAECTQSDLVSVSLDCNPTNL